MQRFRVCRPWGGVSLTLALLVAAGGLTSGCGSATRPAEAQTTRTRTFVIPHLLETSGRITNTQNTFDTSIFMTYSAGLVDASTPTGATVDLYLFHPDGQPIRGSVNQDVCNPCSLSLDATARKASFDVDQILTDAGYFQGRAAFLGFALLVVGGDLDHVNITSAVVNAKSSALDLSVFLFEPQPIGAPAN